MKALPDYIEFKKFDRIPFKDIFTAATDDLMVLIESMLDVNPSKRCTATQVGTGVLYRGLGKSSFEEGSLLVCKYNVKMFCCYAH